MKIHFEYSTIFDQHISELMGTTLDEKVVLQVEKMIPRLNEEWQKQGDILLSTASELSEFRFNQSEMKCIVTVSEFVSMSHPLIVNVKKYLDRSNIDFLMEVVFHELLHVLLTDNWKVWPTELLKKHSNQDRTIESHLHLMSLERATHIKLGNHRRLEEISLWYEMIGGSYIKSWIIVNENENFLNFVSELKDNTQWGRT